MKETLEPRLERSAGAGQTNIWRRAFQAEVTAGAKALRQGRARDVWEAGKRTA